MHRKDTILSQLHKDLVISSPHMPPCHFDPSFTRKYPALFNSFPFVSMPDEPGSGYSSSRKLQNILGCPVFSSSSGDKTKDISGDQLKNFDIGPT